jgi:hypothetical protein
MTKHRVEVWVSYNYGGWHLSFSKSFDLPFTPFPGLILIDKYKNEENEIRMENHSYCTTTILYDIRKDAFLVDVRNVWKRPVDEEVIDEALEIFKKTGWTRMDSAKIPELKELMKRDYETNKI